MMAGRMRMFTKRMGWLLIAAAAVGAAQVATQLSVQQQVRVTNGKAGQLLAVGDNGQDVVLVSMPAPGQIVLASPAAPGCAADPTKAGAYRLARPVTSVAVYRNGVRASMPGEFTVTGLTLTMATPIPGEVVLCDFTF